MTLREIERLAVVETKVEDLRASVAAMDGKLDELLISVKREEASQETARAISRQLMAAIAASAALIGALGGLVTHVFFH